MTDCISNQCPQGNTQTNIDDFEDVLLHGPTWRRRMKNDQHFREVVLPALKGWIVKPNELGWLDVITPWRPEVLQ